MDIKLHKTATTTPRIRQEIQQAPASVSDMQLARRYHVSGPTIARWRYRDTQHDRSHTQHNLLTTLSPAQKEIVVALREYLRLSGRPADSREGVSSSDALAFGSPTAAEAAWHAQPEAGESASPRLTLMRVMWSLSCQHVVRLEFALLTDPYRAAALRSTQALIQCLMASARLGSGPERVSVRLR